METNLLWWYVREVRGNYLLNTRYSQLLDTQSKCESFAKIDDIRINTEALKRFFNITSDLSITTQAFPWHFNIDHAGKLFVYLNSCPDQFMLHLYDQILNLWQRSLAEMIILTLNSAKNSTSESHRKASKRLLKGMAVEGKFQYNQPNFGLDEEDWIRDMKNVKGHSDLKKSRIDNLILFNV